MPITQLINRVVTLENLIANCYATLAKLPQLICLKRLKRRSGPN